MIVKGQVKEATLSIYKKIIENNVIYADELWEIQKSKFIKLCQNNIN